MTAQQLVPIQSRIRILILVPALCALFALGALTGYNLPHRVGVSTTTGSVAGVASTPLSSYYNSAAYRTYRAEERSVTAPVPVSSYFSTPAYREYRLEEQTGHGPAR